MRPIIIRCHGEDRNDEHIISFSQPFCAGERRLPVFSKHFNQPGRGGGVGGAGGDRCT